MTIPLRTKHALFLSCGNLSKGYNQLKEIILNNDFQKFGLLIDMV